jgi:mono/diheme cytochrome c family protein
MKEYFIAGWLLASFPVMGQTGPPKAPTGLVIVPQGYIDNCSRCHGMDGAGPQYRIPDKRYDLKSCSRSIRGTGKTFNSEEFSRFLTEKHPKVKMPPGGLEEIRAYANHIAKKR